MNDYCANLADPTIAPSILSACIQAAALLQAGHEQAVATWGVGGLTLLAGVGAVIAGVLAYRAAIRQITFAENQDRLQAEAFKKQFMAHIDQAEAEIEKLASEFKAKPREFLTRGYKSEAFRATGSLIERLSPSNWQEFARFGKLYYDGGGGPDPVLNHVPLLRESLEDSIEACKSAMSATTPPNTLSDEDVARRQSQFADGTARATLGLGNMRRALASALES